MKKATPLDAKGRYRQCLVCGEPLPRREPRGTARSICADKVCRNAYGLYWRRGKDNEAWLKAAKEEAQCSEVAPQSP